MRDSQIVLIMHSLNGSHFHFNYNISHPLFTNSFKNLTREKEYFSYTTSNENHPHVTKNYRKLNNDSHYKNHLNVFTRQET